MGWFSSLTYRETDTVSTAAELVGCFKGIGFSVQEDGLWQEDVLIERFKITRGDFMLTVLWDGKVATFLQMVETDGEPEFQRYQDFHVKGRYFVLTYGGPNHTVIVKHVLFMSRECPVIAASIERVLGFWQDDVVGALENVTKARGRRHA